MNRLLFFLMVFGFVVISCKKEQSRNEIILSDVEVDGQMVDLLNENTCGLKQLAVCFSKEDRVVYCDDLGFSDDAYHVFFENGNQLSFPILSKYRNLACPKISMIYVDSAFFWTLNDSILMDDHGAIIVDSTCVVPKLSFESGCWFYTTNGSEYKYCEAKESFHPIAFENSRDCGFVVFVLPIGCKIVVPKSDYGCFLKADSPNNSFYKDVFLDAGIGLTSRKGLYAVNHLGMSLECMSFSSEDYMDLQNQLMAGDSIDINGRLLYPDGQPRYRLLFVNGGRATTHGQSLSDRSRSNMRDFFYSGGSYVGTCAGAFLASMGYNRPNENPYYFHFFPEFVSNTHLTQSQTGFTIPTNSPLLQYYDFGGDYYVDSIRHNGGCYADVLPLGSEVLARYDCPEYNTFHRQPSAWSFKESETTGRIIQIGSHPEEVQSGEQRDFTAASIRYAIEGRGKSVVKGVLNNGLWRDMNKTTEDENPDYTMIGDLQSHHFVSFIPKDAIEVSVTLKSEADVDLSLMLRRNVFAYEDNAQYIASDGGANQQLYFPKLSPGLWYIAVKCNTTVETVETNWGQEYVGRTDVLNGIPYSIKVSWSTPSTLSSVQSMEK